MWVHETKYPDSEDQTVFVVLNRNTVFTACWETWETEILLLQSCRVHLYGL